MSTIANGTRLPQTTARTVATATRGFDRRVGGDAGLAANVTGPLVFTSAPPQIALAGALGAFQPDTPVLVEGTALNNGRFYVTAVDPAGGFVTVTPPPKPETPAVATMRVA